MKPQLSDQRIKLGAKETRKYWEGHGESRDWKNDPINLFMNSSPSPSHSDRILNIQPKTLETWPLGGKHVEQI